MSKHELEYNGVGISQMPTDRLTQSFHEMCAEYTRRGLDASRYLTDAMLPSPVLPTGWSIDTSTGRDILTHDGCSVIEGDTARQVFALIAGSQQPALLKDVAEAVEELTRLEAAAVPGPLALEESTISANITPAGRSRSLAHFPIGADSWLTPGRQRYWMRSPERNLLLLFVAMRNHLPLLLSHIRAGGLTEAQSTIRGLERVIVHAYVHSGYKDCGRSKMSAEDKAVYDGIVARLLSGESFRSAAFGLGGE